jgi:hypothetical protein
MAAAPPACPTAALSCYAAQGSDPETVWRWHSLSEGFPELIGNLYLSESTLVSDNVDARILTHLSLFRICIFALKEQSLLKQPTTSEPDAILHSLPCMYIYNTEIKLKHNTYFMVQA